MGMWAPVALAQVTPEQLQMLQQLSPEQRRQLLEQIGGGAAVATQPALSQPTVDKPKEAPSAPAAPSAAEAAENKVEGTAQAAQDAPTLAQKSEVLETPGKLEQFGYDLFRNVPTTFAPATDIPVPANYTIGPGDTVMVQLFGKDNAQYSLVVSRDGQLNFPGIGPIAVAGLTFSDMQDLLLKRVTEQMIGVRASITMGPLRSIQIFVLGEAERPGAYTVSSLATITNALFASGGVKRVGSLRDIQLKRGGQTVTHLDLYDLLLRGDTSNDERLMPGDVLFIPPIGPSVGVAGEVRRPAIYELSSLHTTAGQMILMAGGFVPTAFPAASQIERISDEGAKTIVDIDLSNLQRANLRVRDGDVVRVYSILGRMDNVVLLSGHVQRPGGYQWRPGLRLTDVIRRVEDLQPRPDLGYVVVRREVPPNRHIEIVTTRLDLALADPKSASNLLLKPRDEIIVFGANEGRSVRLDPVLAQVRQQAGFERPEPVVQVLGNVEHPGSYPLVAGMRISDLLRAAHDVRADTILDYAALVRQPRPGVLVSEWVRLGEARANPGSESDVLLQPRDRLFVVGQGDARGPLFEEVLAQLRAQSTLESPPPIVTASGNVHHAASYPLGPGMRVSDLLAAAYGVRPDTDLSYAVLARAVDRERIEVHTLDLAALLADRASPDNVILQPLDNVYVFGLTGDRSAQLKEIVDRLRFQARSGEPSQEVTITGGVRFPGVYPRSVEMRVSDLLRAGGSLDQAAYLQDAEITRFRIENGVKVEVEHLPVQLSKILAGDASADIALEPYDSLHVKQIADWRQAAWVELRGEVRFPGTYVLEKGETLRQLLGRAGGLTDEAYSFGTVFLREELKVREQRQIDGLRDRLRADVAAASLQNMAADPDQAQSFQLAKNLLAQLETTKAVGRMALDVPRILANKETDVILTHGDSILVPRRPQEVTVIGEVNFPTSHLHRSGHSLGDYIDLSGSYTAKADRARTYVVRVNGEVLPRSIFMTMLPGDTIVVPLDTERVKPLTFWGSIAQIVYQLGLSAAAFKAIGAF